MDIRELLRTDLMIMDLKARTKAEVIDEMVHNLFEKGVIKDEEAKRKLDELVKKLAGDARIRDASKAYFYKAAKDATTKEERREIGKPINSALYKAVSNTAWNMLSEDKGYDAQEKRDAAINCLLRLFRDASQEKNQMRASRDLVRERYRNLSETARKNLRKEREQQGSWSPEL